MGFHEMTDHTMRCVFPFLTCVTVTNLYESPR